MAERGLRAMRRRCQQRLDALELPHPYTASALAERLTAQRGRPVVLIAMGRSAGPCGVWIDARAADYVFYDPAATGLHREHILAHELAHVLCGHGSPDTVSDDLAAVLMPDLAPGTVRAILSRDSYNTREEQEAEVLASLVVQHADAGVRERSYDARAGLDADPRTDPAVRQLSQALGRRRQPGRDR